MTTQQSLRESFMEKFERNIGGNSALIVFNAIADFWLAKREAELKEILEEVEGMKNAPEHQRDWEKGFNQALDTVQELIIKRLKE